jgi:hypothetical protein
MKKCIMLIGIVLLVCVVGLLVMVLIHDDWETAWETEVYFYGEESNEGGADGEFDRDRYRKLRIQANETMTSGDCVLRLVDENGNALQEYTLDGERLEQKLDKDTMHQISGVRIEADSPESVGSCTVVLQGKRKLLSNIQNLFAQ